MAGFDLDQRLEFAQAPCCYAARITLDVYGSVWALSGMRAAEFATAQEGGARGTESCRARLVSPGSAGVIGSVSA